MTNRSKAIGTAAESAVLKVARKTGFPWAERLTLAGSHDRGDIALVPGPAAILEVKGGEQARSASDLDIERWLTETEAERHHAGAEVAVLVVQRRGVGAPNAHRWHAYLRLGDIARLRRYPTSVEVADQAVVRMSLASALVQLRAAGYGEPLTTARAAIDHARRAAGDTEE